MQGVSPHSPSTDFFVSVAVTSNPRWFNIEKARRVLGYEPQVGLEEGVKRAVEVSLNFGQLYSVVLALTTRILRRYRRSRSKEDLLERLRTKPRYSPDHLFPSTVVVLLSTF